MEIAPRISVDKNICFGKPVITGTRVPVDLIAGQVVGGMTIEEVMREYELEREDVLAALAYAEKEHARTKLFKLMDEIQERNKDIDSEEVEREVAEAIREVRLEKRKKRMMGKE
jgi:uncharacterized protein (DUF433 family)